MWAAHKNNSHTDITGCWLQLNTVETYSNVNTKEIMWHSVIRHYHSCSPICFHILSQLFPASFSIKAFFDFRPQKSKLKAVLQLFSSHNLLLLGFILQSFGRYLACQSWLWLYSMFTLEMWHYLHLLMDIILPQCNAAKKCSHMEKDFHLLTFYRPNDKRWLIDSCSSFQSSYQ